MKIFKSYVNEAYLGLKPSKIHKAKITSSEDAYNYLKQIYNPDKVELIEIFVVLYLNRANNVIAWSLISTGGLNGTVADPKIIVLTGIKLLASGMVLSHNHPSGNIKPSESDHKLTKKIKDSAKITDIVILDHIIFTNEKFFSFADEGLI
jgi:DNA repair protein RadC